MSDEPEKQPSPNFFWDNRLEIFSGALILSGLILAFFYLQIGGSLVGLGFGMCFYDEVHTYFLQLRDYAQDKGLFKTLVWIGVVLYFLIGIPAFVIAALIGYGALFFIKKLS
ncbi:MAG: hypothetical protein S4CHLAM123_03680 [Chlamydiales bacterium]|nr:hypothetical protein [Chlamydiales bacterium]